MKYFHMAAASLIAALCTLSLITLNTIAMPIPGDCGIGPESPPNTQCAGTTDSACMAICLSLWTTWFNSAKTRAEGACAACAGNPTCEDNVEQVWILARIEMDGAYSSCVLGNCCL